MSGRIQAKKIRRRWNCRDPRSNLHRRLYVTAGEAQNGTFVYKLASEEAYSESLPTAKDAGTYTIYFMVQGNEN